MIQSSAVTPQDVLSPTKQTQSSLAHDLEAKAVAALAEAHEMPPGDQRSEVINKAIVFRNAAAIHELLSRKRGV